jgi:DNA (cytosine-5)-methyltransferase 1
VWHSEIDKAASKVLAHRYPDVPNLGDITQVDWADVPAVDILSLGFPCQDVSAAGKRAGIKQGTRSGLWSVAADAIEALQPRIVVVENVRGLLSATAHRMESDDPTVGNGAGRPVLRAAGAVLGDLADLGYDAQWATVAAADIGAPHRRERVFIVAQSCSSAVGINTGRTSGAEAGAYPGDRFGDHCGERPDVALFPTPSACNANDGEGTETWLARREVVKARVKNGNGMGMPLSIAVQLLPTPCARDFKDATASPGAVARNTPSLGAVEHYLPTPESRDGGQGDCPSERQRHTPGLSAVDHYLPTPIASDRHAGKRPEGRTGGDYLNTVVEYLPTPAASDSSGGGSHPDRREGHTRQLIDFALLAGSTAWGKYEPAIRRWENRTRPAPAPTEPNKNGNPRLAAAFSEWLMGWPDGWVTDPDIGISRNDQLRIVGNGVCPQQAAAALRYLLAVATDNTHTHTGGV